MVKGMNGMGMGPAKTNYPCTPGEVDRRNKAAHVPFGPKMLPQTEAGAEKLVASHRQIQDRGAIHRTKAHPEEKSSPMDAPVSLPYDIDNSVG